MDPLPLTLPFRRVGILGFGRSGEAAATFLAAAGAQVVVFDDLPEKREAARAAGFTVAEEADAAARLDLLLASPGVPAGGVRVHPVIAAARGAGVPVTVDVQLWRDLDPVRPLVGVTGTNGKSTTTALIAHLLQAAGRPAAAVGNIGTPVFAARLPPGAVAVAELSSFQLELCRGLHPQVAVWTNFAPDHLDRHGSEEAYFEAKLRLFADAGPHTRAVIGVDDPHSAGLAALLRRRGLRVVRVSVTGAPADVRVVEGVLHLPQGPAGGIDLRHLRSLRGAHNHQNAALAAAAAVGLGVDPDTLAAALPTFPGLPHRMREIARIGRVVFVDDSKATNPDSAARSLACFEHVHWIAGGRPKPGGFGTLRAFAPRIRTLYAIGEAAPELAETFRDLVPVRMCGTLDVAVREAAAAAAADPVPDPVVLLAPACASFDQFTDYAHRGRVFVALVAALGTEVVS